jgi:hypothetical protein
MDVFNYCAETKPTDVARYMSSKGYPLSERHNLSDQFKDFFKKSTDKEDILVFITEIHPDRNLFEETKHGEGCRSGGTRYDARRPF